MEGIGRPRSVRSARFSLAMALKYFYIVEIAFFNCPIYEMFCNNCFLGESQRALYLMKVMCPTVQSFSDVKLFITVLLASG